MSTSDWVIFLLFRFLSIDIDLSSMYGVFPGRLTLIVELCKVDLLAVLLIAVVEPLGRIGYDLSTWGEKHRVIGLIFFIACFFFITGGVAS